MKKRLKISALVVLVALTIGTTMLSAFSAFALPEPKLAEIGNCVTDPPNSYIYAYATLCYPGNEKCVATDCPPQPN